MTTAKNVLVIGALSLDDIKITRVGAAAGAATIAEEQYFVLGGRGVNASICTYRAAHDKPTDDSNIAQPPDSGGVEVQLKAAALDDYHLGKFNTHLQENGINTDGVEVLPRLADEPLTRQDSMISIVNLKERTTAQILNFNTSNQWPEHRFDTVEKICGTKRPDLVIVTMELKLNIVHRIIKTMKEARIDVLLFAKRGEFIRHDMAEIYNGTTHLIADESDAAAMLGYRDDEVNADNWRELCRKFIAKGVKNVVLKLSHKGAYYMNEDGAEGFASGMTSVGALAYKTGST